MKNKNYYDDFDDDWDYDLDWDFGELDDHKKKDTVKGIITAISLFLVTVMLIGLCLQVFGQGNVKPSEWFAKDKSEAATDGLVLTTNNSNTSKIRLMSARAASLNESDNTFTLTAVISPSNALNKDVDWTVSWADAESVWANGKTATDYVTATPTSDGALTATITCIKAFGAKIRITVTSRENSMYSAECICDYQRKITGFSFTYGKMKFTDADETIVCDESFVCVHSSGLVNSSITYKTTDYTIDKNYSGAQITTTINPTFKNYLTAAGLTPKRDTLTYSSLWGGSAFFYCYAATPGGMQECSFCGFTPEQANQAIEIAKAHTDIPIYTITIKPSSYSDAYSHTVPVYFSAESLTSVVTGISLNATEHVF